MIQRIRKFVNRHQLGYTVFLVILGGTLSTICLYDLMMIVAHFSESNWPIFNLVLTLFLLAINTWIFISNLNHLKVVSYRRDRF